LIVFTLFVNVNTLTMIMDIVFNVIETMITLIYWV